MLLLKGFLTSCLGALLLAAEASAVRPNKIARLNSPPSPLQIARLGSSPSSLGDLDIGRTPSPDVSLSSHDYLSGLALESSWQHSGNTHDYLTNLALKSSWPHAGTGGQTWSTIPDYDPGPSAVRPPSPTRRFAPVGNTPSPPDNDGGRFSPNNGGRQLSLTPGMKPPYHSHALEELSKPPQNFWRRFPLRAFNDRPANWAEDNEFLRPIPFEHRLALMPIKDHFEATKVWGTELEKDIKLYLSKSAKEEFRRPIERYLATLLPEHREQVDESLFLENQKQAYESLLEEATEFARSVIIRYPQGATFLVQDRRIDLGKRGHSLYFEQPSGSRDITKGLAMQWAAVALERHWRGGTLFRMPLPALQHLDEPSPLESERHRTLRRILEHDSNQHSERQSGSDQDQSQHPKSKPTSPKDEKKDFK